MKSPSRPMPVMNRPMRFPEGAFAVALLEGRVATSTQEPVHVVAMQDGKFVALVKVSEKGTFAMQLRAGSYRLVAFEGSGPVASMDLAATLGVHEVTLVPGSFAAPAVVTDVLRDDGWKN